MLKPGQLSHSFPRTLSLLALLKQGIQVSLIDNCFYVSYHYLKGVQKNREVYFIETPTTDFLIAAECFTNRQRSTND